MTNTRTNTRKTEKTIRKANGRATPAKRITKNAQLETMLSKPSGCRVSLIGERLGWQPHTVRAAISGLRKAGRNVVRETSKTGEAIYRIAGRTRDPEAAASSAAEQALQP